VRQDLSTLTGRNAGIDSLKGILILLMIAGHILQGKVSENFFRFVIYSFHMPLFIGIGGYLLSVSTTIEKKPGLFLFRLFKRPVFPWLIAMLAYSILPNLFQAHSMKEMGKIVLQCFIFPYHHLWFIPAYLGWIFGTLLLRKLNLKPHYLLLIALVISFLFYPVNHELVFLKWIPSGGSVLHYIGRTFHVQFFFFFVLGFYGYRNSSTFPIRINMVFLFLMFWLYSFTFANEIWLAAAPVYFVFNFTFIHVFFQLLREEKLIALRPLALIGRNSLPIYLWHIFPIVFAGLMIPDLTDLRFYSLALLLELALIISIVYLTRIKIIQKYFFGGEALERP
jgi:acyltransferase